MALPSLHLGDDRERGGAVDLPASALLRHVFAVGSSGSGKTVLCKRLIEQAARAGIPSICVDPQGDLASVALADGELGALIDPVIFTPASADGVGVCADPIAAASGDDVERWSARAGRLLASTLGYNLASDDGDGVAVALAALLARHRERRAAPTLATFLAALDHLMAEAPESAVVSARVLAAAVRRLRRLEAPGRRALFAGHAPLDIDTLLAGAPSGRARVAIVYLNSLESDEDKALVVATLAERLVRWMLANPKSEPQLLFYIDEVAPYVPPVRKPACKEALVTLLKQARKYGLGCLLASQNPGDVDYRALGQLGSWAIGRLVTRQDHRKIEPAVSSLAGAGAERVMDALPRLGPGQFYLLSPDHAEHPIALDAARTEAPHRTLDRDEVRALADERWRDRFAAPEPVPEPEPAPAPTAAPEAPAPPLEKKPVRAATPAPVIERIAETLADGQGRRADALAEAIGMSESAVRRHLRGLVDQKRVAKIRRGREVHYLWVDGGGRADLELGATVRCARRQLGAERAGEIAQGYIRSRLFGLLADAEALAGIDAIDAPLYAISYREPLRPGAIGRLLGERTSHLEGRVYLDPLGLEILTYGPSDGVRFRPPSSRRPTDIEDLDGHVELYDGALASVRLDETRWKQRQPLAAARERFLALFDAEIIDIAPVLLPLYRARFEQRRGGATRVLLMDGLRGHPFEWPDA